MEERRLVTLSDGTGMGDDLMVFKTNAPSSRLKELETLCCQIYESKEEADIPIWSDVLEKEGYVFTCIAEHQHITAYSTSESWLEEKFPGIKEHYVIENQPSKFLKVNRLLSWLCEAPDYPVFVSHCDSIYACYDINEYDDNSVAVQCYDTHGKFKKADPILTGKVFFKKLEDIGRDMDSDSIMSTYPAENIEPNLDLQLTEHMTIRDVSVDTSCEIILLHTGEEMYVL